uniref:Uncharacterized protein n=1 Tax=Glossina brevipalpis TaxID=37001 RepID=A0A1A9X383_9MUSC
MFTRPLYPRDIFQSLITTSMARRENLKKIIHRGLPSTQDLFISFTTGTEVYNNGNGNDYDYDYNCEYYDQRQKQMKQRQQCKLFPAFFFCLINTNWFPFSV